MSLYPASPPTLLSGLPEGVAGAKATLKAMADIAKRYKTDGGMRTLALSITRQLPEHDDRAEITALQHFVRDRIRYVRDVEGVETLQTPPYTLQMGAGDCDDKSILLATLLMAVGYKPQFLAVGINGGFFSHVLAAVRLGTRVIPLETIVPGAEPGWMPPNVTAVLPWNL